MTPQPTDGNGIVIPGYFTIEKVINTAGTGAYGEITAPIDCKGYKTEVTDTAAPYSYDFFYQALFKTALADTAETVIRNGEFKGRCFRSGQVVGAFKAETGKTIRLTFID